MFFVVILYKGGFNLKHKFPCFFCRYYSLIPSYGYSCCKLHDKVIYFNSPCCNDFDVQPGDDLLEVLDL